MNVKMKNIAQSEVLTLKDEISYQKGQVVSKTLAQNDAVSITLFSFDKGEEISTHAAGGDAFVTCLDGVGRIVLDGTEYLLHEGESIVMPAGHPHAVSGAEMFKMLLVGYLYGIKSERRLVQEVQLNIAYRWFCGFELADKSPDHSTFSKTRLRKWNESQLFQQVFLEIIRRCVKNGLIDGRELKIRVESYNFQPGSLLVNRSNS